METLVLVADHRNQCYKKNRSLDRARFDSFGSSPPSRKFQELNCRTFQSGTGLLPTPLKSLSPKTPSSSSPVRAMKSNSVPLKMNFDFFNSELWAGPTYSNSPPPSSLPIPKFSVRPKRTVSLELSSSVSSVDLRPIAKSAPSSPTRERSSFPTDNVESATKDLCRILNLDM